ncbi:MAG: helix-hairpin-helix domain-containing protein, partial [Synergistaceae bacterium]
MEQFVKLPVIVEWVRTFGGGFSLVSANLNPYSEYYSDELEKTVDPYINKKYNTFTITASLSDENDYMKGGQFIFVGKFVKHPKYGHQFKADFFYDDIPATEDGLKSFLMMLPNIKEQRSQSIIAKFGVKGTLDILDNDIYRLTEINGITTQRVPAIEIVWQSKKYLRELYEFFISREMPPKMADECYKKWGKKTRDIIEENPYKLVELRGIGFVTADKFAHKVMDEVKDDFRTVACMRYVLEEAVYSNSNLCIPYRILKENVILCLRKCDEELNKKVDSKKYLNLIPLCLKRNLDIFSAVKDLETGINYVYLSDMWEKEKFIAKSIFERSKSDHSKSECTASDLIRAEKDISSFVGREIQLDEAQKEAIQSVFDH